MTTEARFFIDHFVRFFEYVRITGGLFVQGRSVSRLKIIQSGSILAEAPVNLPSPAHGINCRFEVFFIAPTFDPQDVTLLFEFEDGATFPVTGKEAVDLYLHSERDGNRCENRFFATLQTPGYDRILEIGSRARSNISRRGLFKDKQYTGLDIMKGENVDIVGDAHSLAAHFPQESFDGLYSVSTFEHLAMPWKVALEANRVLRQGGVAYFVTHQALGMHETPWDFWRFSDTSWNSLFNSYTGFRVLETFLGTPMMLVPHIYHDHWKGYETATGFSTSAVLIEKTGPASMEWNLDVARVTQGFYPA
jgi:hypothetical protein